jgi:hypothetical protein
VLGSNDKGESIVLRTAFRVSRWAGLLAVLLLLGMQGVEPGPAEAASQTHVVAELGANCLGGHFWPGGVPVDIELRDSGGNVIYTVTVTTDQSGNFIVNLEDNHTFCDIPVSLHPGMTYAASDGTTTKTLLIKPLTFDRLDPDSQTAAGTAPPNRPVQVYSYWDTSGQDLFVKADPVSGPSGDWFVNVGAIGGHVESDSRADAFLQDDGADGNYDYTRASIFVTAVSLSTSSGSVSSLAMARAAGTRVRRGDRVRLSGALSARTVACVSRKRVQLLKLRGGKKRVLGSTRTTKSGRYSFSRKVRRTTRFMVRYRRNRVCQRSKSRVKTVRVARA